jgi:hypothetical protein
MSETDQFWQYAREAMLSVGGAKTDEEKQDLLELARTWTQAALQERARPIVDRSAEAGAAQAPSVMPAQIVTHYDPSDSNASS